MSTGAPVPAGADRAADQVAQLLAAVLAGSPRTVSDLASELGVPAGELRPVLEAAQRHGLVTVDPDPTMVRPGPALKLVHSDLGTVDLAELARPNLARLARETGETANLIMPRRAGTEAIEQTDGSHLLGVTNWIGRLLGLHTTAAGKVFLAFGAATLPEGELRALTPATITDRGALDAQLEAVRQRGFATIVDELEPGLSAVAAPIREPGGAVIAVLCVSGASLRLASQRLELLGRVTVEQANEISERLEAAAASVGR